MGLPRPHPSTLTLGAQLFFAVRGLTYAATRVSLDVVKYPLGWGRGSQILPGEGPLLQSVEERAPSQQVFHKQGWDIPKVEKKHTPTFVC